MANNKGIKSLWGYPLIDEKARNAISDTRSTLENDYQKKNDDTLTTNNKSISGAINEVKNDIIGDKGTLTTTNKTNIVESINEVNVQYKDIVDKKIDNVALSDNRLTFLANNKNIKTITLPSTTGGTSDDTIKTISSKVLATVPASSIKLDNEITVNNISINKDRRYYIEFLGSKKLCSLLVSEENGNCIICSIGGYLIEVFYKSTNVTLFIYKINKDDTTIDTFTDLVIYEEEVKYLDSKYIENDLVLQNSISLGRKGDIGEGSSAIGIEVEASGMSSHAEGDGTTASGENSHAEGLMTTASGAISHAEGSNSTASGENSHAEGGYTIASGDNSHAQGYNTIASGENSHAEGGYTTASEYTSHAEGDSTIASAYCSHAEGMGTTASGDTSHAEGYNTTASSEYQHVQGKYNIEDTTNKYAHIVGNGTDDSTRANAHTLDWEGNGWFAGKLSQEGTPTEDKDLTTKKYVDNIKTDINNIKTDLGTEELFTGKSIKQSINEVNAQYKDIASSKLDKNDKIKSSQLSTDTDADKIKLVNLADEVRQAITGDAPVSSVIPNKSITLDKLSFVTTGKNLLNKNTAVQGKCLTYNETTLYDKDDYYVSDFIEIEPSTQYTCNYMYGYAYYDSQKAGISGHTPPKVGGTNTITTPENVKYIRLAIYKTRLATTQFEKGATATSFEDYNAYISNQYVQRQPFIADEVPDKSLSIDKLNFVKYTKNLFNVSKVSKKGWYMNYLNGTPQSNQYTTQLCYSDYIKVEQGEYIVNEILHSYCYLDENKKYISGATSQKANTVLNIPVGCKYVVINITYDNKEKYQLQKGNVVTPLEPYGYNLDGMIDNVESKNILSLPEKYELVVGDTFELFYKGIMLCNNPYNYNIKISCSKGSAYSKRYIFTPVTSDIGTHTMTISIIDDDEKLLDFKTINLVVKNKASSPTTNKNILCVGDSLTVNGVWVSELCRRLTRTDGNPIADSLSNIKFIGTCTGTDGAKYEGYGGWSYKSYNSAYKLNSYMWITTAHTKTQTDQHSVYKDTNGTQWKLETIETGKIKLIRINNSGTLPATGTLKWVSGGADKSDIVYSASEIAAGNPFWNESSGKVDFSNYATSLGVTSIDYCYVLLGWNQSYAMETEYKQSVKTFINNLLAAFPSCKIGLVGLEVPSLDGFGENYGCGWNYFDKLKFVFNVNQWYFDLAQEFANVDFVNLAGQFDSENNMQTGTRQVNTRNTKTETYGTNGVHPANEGYLQIADAVYRHITHMLQD